MPTQRRYEAEEASKAYVFWLDSGPFGRGGTVTSRLRGRPKHENQANGAMMRISPLEIFRDQSAASTGIRMTDATSCIDGMAD